MGATRATATSTSTSPGSTTFTRPAESSTQNIEKTDEINRLGVNRGLVIEGRPQERRSPTRRANTSTADLIRTGGGLQLPEEREHPIPKTKAGNLDLFTLQRTQPSRTELAAALEKAYGALNAHGFQLWAGTRDEYLLVEKTTENDDYYFGDSYLSTQSVPSLQVLHEPLKIAGGIRILVHGDPTFMVMDGLKRQFAVQLN